jgi:CheY-like chemotaxis protein
LTVSFQDAYLGKYRKAGAICNVESRHEGLKVPRILVADDNTNIQKMVALAFQDRGIDVTAVGNGEAAVRRIPDLNPDLVLADIFMPVRNGYELCEWIKKDSKFSHIPVILLVGAFDPLDEKEARRVGADDVLKKPFIPPDPLIAMVLSALEKNPKIAAELHHPKEPAASQQHQPAAVQAPKPPLAPAPSPFVPAASAVELPTRIAPKPLPSFPDPTPDEAELAYAFGTGQRALDDLADAEDAKALKSQDESAEEFDGASTSSDWRRSRMDFEIPEDSANKPAFSAVDELESNFSPEKAASHTAPLEESVRDVNIPPQQSVTAGDAEVAVDWAASIKEFAPSERNSSSEDVSHHTQRQSADSSVPAEQSHQEAISSAETVSAVESVEPAQEIEASAPPAQEAGAEVAAEVAIEPEPTFASRATHWMDLMASASELPPQDWFASVVPPAAATVQAASVHAADETEPQPEVAAIEEFPEPLAQATIPQEQDEHIDASPSAAISSPPSILAQPSEDDSFFADEENEAALETAVSEIHVESAHTSDAVSSDVSTETPAEDRPVELVANDSVEHIEQHEQPEKHHDEPTLEASAPREEAAALVSDSEDSLPSYKEPDLVEPPAVHVTPEPLLVTESHRESPVYGARYEEVPPVHSFQLPTPEKPTEAEQAVEHAAIKSPSEQASPKNLPEERLVPHASLEFPPELFDERMPTVPSHLREHLDEIPYLNPPPDFHEYADGHSAINHFATDSLLVDAVVEKVLQRIEPQLRELLSQNVLKPIVEAILHGELEGKRH